MDNTFKNDEKLYRAIWPPEIMPVYWKSNGDLSTAAFTDKNGLSVDRGYYRKDEDVINDMKKRLSGMFFYLTVRNCNDVGAHVLYKPSSNNPYHSEIHGSNNAAMLSREQRTILAKKAVRVG